MEQRKEREFFFSSLTTWPEVYKGQIWFARSGQRFSKIYHNGNEEVYAQFPWVKQREGQNLRISGIPRNSEEDQAKKAQAVQCIRDQELRT